MPRAAPIALASLLALIAGGIALLAAGRARAPAAASPPEGAGRSAGPGALETEVRPEARTARRAAPAAPRPAGRPEGDPGEGRGACALRGVAVDQRGAGVPGARVLLHGAAGTSLEARTEADGGFAFGALLPGRARLELDPASLPGDLLPPLAPLDGDDFTVVVPAPAPVELRLVRAGAVHGSARTPDGAPLAGLTVQLAMVGGGAPLREVQTDGDGRFELDRLYPASYDLWTPGWADGTSPDQVLGALPRPMLVIVEAGESTCVGALVTGGGTASVAGRALDRDGAPLEGVRIQVLYSEPQLGLDPVAGGVLTDPEGRFLVQGLEPGSALVEIAPLIIETPDPGLHARLPVWLPPRSRLDLPEQRFRATAPEIARRRKEVEGLLDFFE